MQQQDRAYSALVQRARRLAAQHGESYFIVREAGRLDLCTAEDLATFYAGISEDNILYCTADEE